MAEIEAAIHVIQDSGAIEAVELEIEELAATADGLIAALDIDAAGRESLAGLLRTWGVRAA